MSLYYYIVSTNNAPFYNYYIKSFDIPFTIDKQTELNCQYGLNIQIKNVSLHDSRKIGCHAHIPIVATVYNPFSWNWLSDWNYRKSL